MRTVCGCSAYVRGSYECLPETVVSLAAVAKPDYKLSPVCVSSDQCTYSRVLTKSRLWHFSAVIFVEVAWVNQDARIALRRERNGEVCSATSFVAS